MTVCFCGEEIEEIDTPEILVGLPWKDSLIGDKVWVHIATRDNRCYPEDTAHPASRKLVATPEEDDLRLGEV